MELSRRLWDSEKKALVRLLALLALEDGVLSDAEVARVKAFATPLGLSIDEVLADVYTTQLDAVCGELTRPEAARIVVMELVRLGYADGAYSHPEQAKVELVAITLGLDLDLLRRIESWVDRGREWELEGVELVFGRRTGV